MAPRSTSQHPHAVQFYGNDAALYDTVGVFLADGLFAHQPALVIATPAHRAGIIAELRGKLIDCDQAIRDGELVVLDAEETLDLFMVGDEPNAELFHANLGRLIDQVLNGRTGVLLRAYGEMVDVLWKRDRLEAAIQLELLWNKLAAKYDFALLCGYAMGSFYKQATSFQAVCAQHSHVLKTRQQALSVSRHMTSAS